MTIVFADAEGTALNDYMCIMPEINQADQVFFKQYPHRQYFIRKPYPGEMNEPNRPEMKDWSKLEATIVVRHDGQGLVDRRAFKFLYGDVDVFQMFHSRDEETIGQALWAVWTACDGDIDLCDNAINVVIHAFRDLEAYPLKEHTSSS